MLNISFGPLNTKLRSTFRRALPALLLLSFAAAATPTYAAPEISISAALPATTTSAVALDIEVTGFAAGDAVVAVISVPEGGGSLSFGDTTGLTLLHGYGGYTNRAAIGVSGTAAAVTAALDTLSWNAPMHAQAVELTLMVSELPANTYYNPNNDHYYRLVQGVDSWGEAYEWAPSYELFGMVGYLATITSAQENNFISNYTNTSDIWISATDNPTHTQACDANAVDGDWYWIAGPETCTPFWKGHANGSPVNSAFASWQNGEPNSAGGTEHYAATNYGGEKGKWNDFINAAAVVDNYLVEFGGMDEERSGQQVTVTTTLTASAPIVIGKINDGVVTPGTIEAATNETVTVGAELHRYATNGDLVAVVKVGSGGGALSVTQTAGLTLSHGYSSYVNQAAIGFHGSYDDVAAALMSLTWTAPAEGGAATLAVSVGDYITGYYYNADNNHYYLPVSGGTITWSAAAADASSRTLQGMTGYLATITSDQENEFVKSYVDADNIWIGASDAGSEGAWRWATGPEAGTVFCNGNNPCVAGYGMYTSWASGEPNNHGTGEHYAVTNWSSTLGRWNDLPGNHAVSNYLVEFGGMPYEVSTIRSASAEAKTRFLSVTVNAPEGATTIENEDGTITTRYGDTQVTTYADNSSAGSVTVSDSNGRTSTVQFEGGVTSMTIGEDGSITSVNVTNGITTTTIVHPDGSITYSQVPGVGETTVAAGSSIHIDELGNLTVVEEQTPLAEPAATVNSCYVNDFASGSLSGWTVLRSQGYQPQVVELSDGGLGSRLRLTDANNSRATGITRDLPIPSDGIVELEFYAHAYGGNGADGMAVILSDWDVAPVVGAPGGSLGYAQRNRERGFAGGWIGIGIDEYGNFANANEGKAGGEGFRRNAVSIRGSGNGTNGYRYIAGTSANLDPKIDNNYAGHRYVVVIDARNSGSGVVLITVKRDLGRDIGGDSLVTLINAINVLDSRYGQSELPDQFRLSITASTGGLNNIHEISKLAVSASTCVPVNPPEITSDTNATVELIEGSSIVGTVAANSTEDFSYFISGGDNAELFQVNPTTGELSFRDVPAPGSYTVEVSAEDARGGVSEPAVYSVIVRSTEEVAINKIGNFASDPEAPTPTLDDYSDADVTGVTADNLAAVNAAVANADPADVADTGGIQAIVDGVNAIIKVAAYADDSDTAPVPVLDDFTDAGITGVTADNLAVIQAAIAAADADEVNTPAKLQQLVTDVNAAAQVQTLLAALPTTDAMTLDNKAAVEAARVAYDALTEEQQARVPNPTALTDAEAKVAELEAEVAALAKIATYADDQTAPVPTVADYLAANVIGVDAGNLAAVNVAIAAMDGDDVDDAAGIQAVVDRVIAMLIVQANATDPNTATAPVLADFESIGVIGVTSQNLAAIQAAIAAATAADVASPAQLQQLIDATLAALSDVDDVIAHLPAVDALTLQDRDAVEAARQAYDALSPAQQALVANLDALEAAEAKIAWLEPIEVTNAAELAAINDRLDADYVIQNNIDLTGWEWLPLGSPEEPFTGTFTSHNGEPVVISGLKGKPLFDHIGEGALVSDVTIKGNVNNNAGNNSGLLAKVIKGSSSNPVILENIRVDSTSQITGANNVGAIAGTIQHANLTDVKVAANVSGDAGVGGLAGSIFDTTLENVVMNGHVTGSTGRAGGIAGNLIDSDINNAVVNGNVTGGDYVGGIAGELSGGSVSNSVINGAVDGKGTNTGSLGGIITDSELNHIVVNGGKVIDPLVVQLVDGNGNALGDRPVSTGERVRIPVSGGTKPITITGDVSRGGVVQALVASANAGVVLADPDGGAPVLIQEDGEYYFAPKRGGVYTLQFQDGEFRTVNVEFEVRPQVAFTSVRQVATAGQQLVIRAVLEGTPAQYPVIVPYTMTGHHLLSSSDFEASGEFTFDGGEASARIRSLTMVPGTSTGEVTVTLLQGEGPEYAIVGNPATHRVILREQQNLPLSAAIHVNQAGDVDYVINKDEGPVTLTVASAGAAFSTADHSFDWSRSATALSIASATEQQVTIDPSNMAVGAYQVHVRVSEKASAMRTATASLRLQVVGASEQALVASWQEFISAAPTGNRLAICPQGTGSFRGDGEHTCSQIERALNGFYLEVPEGYTLNLGVQSAQASWSTGDFGLQVDFTEFRDEQGVVVSNAEDSAYTHIGFTVDFEVSGLDFPGQSIPVVVPMPAGQTIPANAVWRKYQDTGWTTFAEDDANRLDSAPLQGDVCPWPGSHLWQVGLVEGNNCVRLIIEDGGPNDWDGVADGVIRDPSVLAVAAPAAEEPEPTVEEPEPTEEEPEPTVEEPPAPAAEEPPTPSKLKSGGGSMGMFTLVLLGLLSLAKSGWFARSRRVGAMLIVLVAPAVNAADSWYLFSATVGQARTNVSSAEIERRLQKAGIDGSASLEDENRLGFKLLAGYQFTNLLALEGGYTDLGEITTEFSGIAPTVRVEELQDVRPGSGYGAELALRASYHFHQQLSAFARAGLFAWHAKHNYQGRDASDSGVDPLLGLGLAWQLNNNWAATVSWDSYKVEEDRTQFFGVGAVYSFGGKK